MMSVEFKKDILKELKRVNRLFKKKGYPMKIEPVSLVKHKFDEFQFGFPWSDTCDKCKIRVKLGCVWKGFNLYHIECFETKLNDREDGELLERWVELKMIFEGQMDKLKRYSVMLQI